MTAAIRFADARKDRRVIVMTALGMVSGVLGTFFFEDDTLWQESSVGITFGVIIGAYLLHIRLATPLRTLAFAILSIASWMVARKFAIEIFVILPNSDTLASWQGLVTGVCAGLLGAVLLVISIFVLFPFFRRPRLCILTILVGGAAGALLAFAEVVNSALVLFPIWQGAFAFCFALGFPKARLGEALDGG